MKKNYINLFTLLIILISGKIYSQQGSVGIGTSNPDASAALDVYSTNKGLLLPKVALLSNTDVATIQNPATGLVVYNTANNSIGTTIVTANTFYFWNGTKWTDLINVDTVKAELFPQMFFIAQTDSQAVTSFSATNSTGGTNGGTDPNINLGNVVVINYSPANVVMNTLNNITVNSDSTFKINSTGQYDISGFINYNPNTSGLATTNNLEYIIQTSPDKSNWTNLTKTTSVWSYGTTKNARTVPIAPTVVTLTQGTFMRGVVDATTGKHGYWTNSSTFANASIALPIGLKYSKVLKIQKLN